MPNHQIHIPEIRKTESSQAGSVIASTRMEYIVFGYNGNAHQMYDYIKKFQTIKEMMDDIPNLENRFNCSHFVIYNTSELPYPECFKKRFHLFRVIASRERCGTSTIGQPFSNCYSSRDYLLNTSVFYFN
jgi:hypothetical protein